MVEICKANIWIPTACRFFYSFQVYDRIRKRICQRRSALPVISSAISKLSSSLSVRIVRRAIVGISVHRFLLLKNSCRLKLYFKNICFSVCKQLRERQTAARGFIGSFRPSFITLLSLSAPLGLLMSPSTGPLIRPILTRSGWRQIEIIPQL